MHVKWLIGFVTMVAATLPALGTSSTSISQALQTSSSDIAFMANQPAAERDGSLLFRNTLDVSEKSNGILMAKWEVSRQTEIKDQERIAILPEPGSGILLSIGLIALVYYLGRTEYWNRTL